MSTKTKVVAKINDISILMNQDAEKRVAIKPICEILGVDYSSQLKKIKSDHILSSIMVLSTTVAADGNEREMQTIPLKYIFGWLFRINSKNVKEDAKENVLKYQKQCYDVLFNHFTASADFIAERQDKVEKQLDILKTARLNFKNANKILRDADAELTEIRKMNFEDYQASKRQIKMEL